MNVSLVHDIALPPWCRKKDDTPCDFRGPTIETWYVKRQTWLLDAEFMSVKGDGGKNSRAVRQKEWIDHTTHGTYTWNNLFFSNPLSTWIEIHCSDFRNQAMMVVSFTTTRVCDIVVALRVIELTDILTQPRNSLRIAGLSSCRCSGLEETSGNEQETRGDGPLASRKRPVRWVQPATSLSGSNRVAKRKRGWGDGRGMTYFGDRCAKNLLLIIFLGCWSFFLLHGVDWYMQSSRVRKDDLKTGYPQSHCFACFTSKNLKISHFEGSTPFWNAIFLTLSLWLLRTSKDRLRHLPFPGMHRALPGQADWQTDRRSNSGFCQGQYRGRGAMNTWEFFFPKTGGFWIGRIRRFLFIFWRNSWSCNSGIY